MINEDPMFKSLIFGCHLGIEEKLLYKRFPSKEIKDQSLCLVTPNQKGGEKT